MKYLSYKKTDKVPRIQILYETVFGVHSANAKARVCIRAFSQELCVNIRIK